MAIHIQIDADGNYRASSRDKALAGVPVVFEHSNGEQDYAEVEPGARDLTAVIKMFRIKLEVGKLRDSLLRALDDAREDIFQMDDTRQGLEGIRQTAKALVSELNRVLAQK
jgi:hypothetical protein